MDFFISNAYAQGAGAAQQPGIMGSLVLPLALFVAVFFFMVIRPNSKRTKEHRALIASLAKGDEVVTSTGMLGRVTDLSDSYVSVEIAPNVSVKLQKGAITAVLPKGTLKSA
jgi:preprotein translocase subunit YajC